jgi:molybdopterin synthase sulfur carrier subunit
MKVKVRYFGQFRDLTGKTEEPLEIEKGITVIGIREYVRGIYPKIAAKEDIMVAVNGSFVSLDQVIEEGDEVALFPPVSGG